MEGNKFRVYYRRYQHGVKQHMGKWENVNKEFKTEKDADLFLSRIKDNVIVLWSVKSKIYK